jgi:DNA integrity scanning protein DisA with diadenylate cyclase activity
MGAEDGETAADSPRPVGAEPSIFRHVCSKVAWCREEVLHASLEIAVEIAREGREGRRIGTLFTVGAADAVLASSRALTVKELAQLDGAFVMSEDGTVVAACRYLDATVEDVSVPLGLGSRHLAAASMSRKFDLIAIVVSESAVVRVFYGGALVAEIIPELWLLARHQTQLRGQVTERHVQDLAIFTSGAELGASVPSVGES